VFERGEDAASVANLDEKFCATAGLFKSTNVIFSTRMLFAGGCLSSVRRANSFESSHMEVGNTVCRV
jgi:hypothetical protein